MQYLLDIENLHDGAIDLRHTRNEGTITGPGGWRTHVTGGALHNTLDTFHVQPLTRAAQLGDDQATVVFVSRTAFADGARQVDHRHRGAAQGGDAAHVGVTIGQLGQGWTGNDLVDLEQVDPQQAAAMQTKQQQR